MRVSNSIMATSSLTRLQSNLRSIAEVQERIASGLRIARSSDDPADARSVMQASTSLRELAQFRRNVTSATSRLGVEEGAISQLGDLLARAQELALAESGGTSTAQTRAITAEEIRQLQASAIALGNTQFGGDFLFGGDYPTRPPFDGAQPLPFRSLDPVSGLPRDPVGRHRIEIGNGHYVDGTRDGKQVFIDSRAFEALQGVLDGLVNNDTPGIRAALVTIDTAIDSLQVQVGEVGARANLLDGTEISLLAIEENLMAYRANLAEVDVEAEFTELVSRQTAYQAAMLITSKISGMNLTEYLR